MKEPNPNRYSSPQNYINALSEYWTKYGGPSNRNRAISMRLQIWFDKENSKKKLLASNASNLHRTCKKIRNISKKLVSNNNKNKMNHQKYSHVRNVMIPRTKANIRVQNSTRMFEQLRSKLGTKLPLNLVSRILSNNVVPSGLMRTGEKVKLTNLDIYTNKNGRFWYQTKSGRWYMM